MTPYAAGEMRRLALVQWQRTVDTVVHRERYKQRRAFIEIEGSYRNATVLDLVGNIFSVNLCVETYVKVFWKGQKAKF